MDAICGYNCKYVNKLIALSILFGCILAKKHTQTFKDDTRSQITLSTFGFVSGGYLFINVSLLEITTAPEDAKASIIGFTLDKSMTRGASPLLTDQADVCHLDKRNWNAGNASIVYFVINFSQKMLLIDRSNVNLQTLNITLDQPSDSISDGSTRNRRDVDVFSDAYLLESSIRRYRRAAAATTKPVTLKAVVPTTTVTSREPVVAPSSNQIPLAAIPIKIDHSTSGHPMISFHFMVNFKEEEMGLYNFLFHNCMKYPVNMTASIEERNPGSYLSIGQQPLSLLFFVSCIVYVAVGSFWLWVMCAAKSGVFKIHYLMLALMYIKALAMLFHAINFYFIGVEGHTEEAFAVLFYIMYLVKGIFMFVTIVLIGAGWTFVKHVLSDRDKKIFVVVIPLQVLAHVATIIIEESDEGMSYYSLLNNIFLVIDLVCCGAILFPVIWSIRHLQQASQTDGKAAINLQKLKIFRHFYILVVCYIYFTRIIVLLVRIAVRFQYEWLDPLFVEIATLIFFVLTGYKFRPASDNPYLQLSQSDDEEEMDEVVTRSGALDSVIKVNNKSRISTTELGDTIKQRENSHEYD